jgi:putative salt-induced outer membrane protein YdiY
MKLILFTLCGLLSISAKGLAEVVTLKNGDRVTGTFVNLKSGKLQLQSDILGVLSIPIDKVSTFSVPKPVALVIKGEGPLRGPLELEPSGDWQVTENGVAHTIKASTVDMIMPTEAYHALVEVNPKPWQAWKGSANVGYALQQGDQESKTFASTVNATRERPATPVFQPHWRSNFSLTALLSHAEKQGDAVTSHNLSTFLRQDYLLTPDNFLFGLAQLDHLATEELYLRQTYGGGYGHDLIKDSRTTFSLIGGLTFVHEKFFTGIVDQSADFLLGEKLGTQITKRARIDHYLNYYPNLTHGAEYRFDTSTVFSVKVGNRFSANVSFIDLYLSTVFAGKQKNNVTVSTGIGYTF